MHGHVHILGQEQPYFNVLVTQTNINESINFFFWVKIFHTHLCDKIS